MIQRFRDPGVSGDIGVEPVRILLAEVLSIPIPHGEQTAHSEEINDRNRPDGPGFLDNIHIFIHIHPQGVGVGFFRLNIGLAEIGIAPVDGGAEDDLLFDKKVFHHRQTAIDPAPEGVRIGVGHAAHPPYHLALSTHFLFPEIPPAARRDGAIIIIGADKDDDGIRTFAMIGKKLFRLPGNIIPLAAVDAVNQRRDLQFVFQELPVIFFSSQMLGIGNGIAEKGNFFSGPRVCHISFSRIF